MTKTPESPDTIFINGNIYTLSTIGKAKAIACKEGMIISVGSTDNTRKLISKSTKIIDLDGKTVVPGFVDAHCHLAHLGNVLDTIDLRDTKSFEEILEKVAKKARDTKPGKWIIGFGWNNENWQDKTLPTYERLSNITPDNPVWLTRIDGHAGLANLKAMEIAGINKNIPNVDGGEIIKSTQTGKPTGIFVDNAMRLFEDVMPKTSAESIKENLLIAQEQCIKFGLTGVHDAGLDPSNIKILKRLVDENKLKIRVYAMVGGDEDTITKYIQEEKPLINYGENNVLTVRSLKLYIDGALGSRGAWLLEPYYDRPTDEKGNPYTGLPQCKKNDIKRITLKALEKGFQVCVHAIGDRGNREVLNAYEEALKKFPVKNHRLRIEHAQIIHPSDIPRFGRLGVIASMQPIHATSDMHMAEKRLGPNRLVGAYAWRKIIESGTKIASGSDFPVESANPLWGFYAAITRQDHEGKPENGWLPEEKMTREGALRSFTIDACYAAFQENIKGTIEEGKYADFVVLSKDIMTITPLEILKTEVLMTIIHGEIVYRR